MKETLLPKLRRNARLIAQTLAVGLLTLLLFGAAGLAAWRDYRDTLIDSQTRQLELVVQSFADVMRYTLTEYSARLDAAAQKVRQNPAVLPNLSASDTIVDLWLEDADGNITAKRYGVEADCDVLLTRTDGISFWQYHSGDRHYLVLKEDAGEETVCLVTDSEAFYEQLVSDIHVGENGYLVIKNDKNRIIMHPERAQWGLDILAGRLALHKDADLDLTSLQTLLDAQLTEESGIMDYYSYWWTDPDLPRVRKVSAFRRIDIGDSFWTVSAVLDYDDLYRPVAESFHKISHIFELGALVLLAIMAYIFSLLLKNRRSADKITALKEVNSALEELHRSEETLAHTQRLQLMGTLTGGIAHEFNNFLTPITGYADLIMAETDPDSEIYDNALEISEAAEKARDVVKQISAMSRKNVETVYETLKVDNLLDKTMKLVHTNCPRQVALQTDFAVGDACILGNATQLQQVLLNICVNGVHAMGAAGGTLTVGADVVERTALFSHFPDEKIPKDWEKYVCIRITDTGCGMDKDTLQHIFEPFFTTKKSGEGTGLGLAVAEQIIHTHRGWLCAESTPGKGSTFFLYLPVEEQIRRQEQLQWGQRHDLRILAADDNQKVLNLLEKDFGRLGLSITTCARREDMEGFLRDTPFDVLLIDESLTDASGVDFCMAIQNRYPALTRIVMVAAPTREIVDAKRHKVIDGYIVKPVAASTLMEVIRESRRK
ncbi:ATP-binding protein [Gemmiger sp.]